MGSKMQIEIDLRTLYEFSGEPAPDVPPPLDVAEAMIREQFGFLPLPLKIEIDGWKGVVTHGTESPATTSEAVRLADKASRRASQGHYDKAIAIWKRALELDPSNYKIRRDLAMAYVEKGETEQAKNHLIDVLRIQPDDVWGLVVLGNLYAKQENKLDTAERFIRRALSVDPHDPWAANTLAAILVEKGKVAEAVDIFARSIAANPSFANPYLGMAKARKIEGRLEDSVETLENLFRRASLQDARSVPVFEEARRMYGSLMGQIAQERPKDASEAIESMKAELAELSGYPVRVKPADIPGNAAASIQMAWKYGRDHHLILHRKDYPEALLAHLFAHELGHLRLESHARAAGRNRLITSTAATREKAIRSMAEDIARWQRQGVDEKSITGVTLQLVDGLARQVFNTPIDMLIETRLHDDFPALRASQFASLALLAQEAEDATTNSEIKKRLPTKVRRASAALNGATALFIDRIWGGGATAYAAPYRNLDSFSISRDLLALFDARAATLKPGDEYEIVDAWAEKLGLQGWYEWKEDTGTHAVTDSGRPQGPTNPELLKQKHPAAVWLMLGALERFDRMTDEEVRKVSFEIALLGTTGLDYASSDQKYTLRSCPGESFSGLQMMCLMYAGFKRIAPDQDVGMDLSEPYAAAVQLHNSQEGDNR